MLKKTPEGKDFISVRLGGCHQWGVAQEACLDAGQTNSTPATTTQIE